MRTTIGARIALGLGLALAGCRDDDAGASGEGADGADDEDSDGSGSDDGAAGSVVPLAPVDQLVRVSMALRGKRPSPADIAAVKADPAVLPAIVDAYLADPAFGETIRDLHNEALLVLADYFIYPAGYEPMGPVAEADVYALNRSIMEAPLRLVEHVVTSDRPYTEIVTADYTVANAEVAAVWGLAHDGGPDEWTETAWSDGRDNAGILADSWLYQRHSSTPSNANRGRANAISRALLCYDFLSRDIEVDAEIDLADPDEVANAVVDNPACASCHQGLDPLASFFRGYYPIYVPATDIEAYPFGVYYPELFNDLLGIPMRDPAFFGAPGDEVGSLGQLIAADPRFSLCAAKRFYAYFHQIDLDAVPMDAEIELQKVLLDSGMNAKALTKAIVLSDDFLVSHLDLPADADVDPEDDVVGVKKARPLQLRQTFADLTGFEWRTDLTILSTPEMPWGLGKVELMDDSFLGYHVLAGGLDSIYVTRPSHTYSATVSLVLRTMAQLAADQVVQSDFAVAAGERRLLARVEPDTIDEVAIRQQLVDLYLRLYAEEVAVDDPAIDETWQLWSAAHGHGNDTQRAWKVVLAALLQDVRIAYY